MPSYPFMQVDAFTSTPLRGNPYTIMFGADDLSDDQQLTVAREMYLSETAFVVQSDVADFGARYFTPAEKIPRARRFVTPPDQLEDPFADLHCRTGARDAPSQSGEGESREPARRYRNC